eukprot:TRINITY_DN3367_c0_g1_i9.p1 TRINITY_DN3367_c0_g1~~TRINITY_DN3367_c0_g1_i9.p1  ORF type:complete len:1030 (-),score=197.59 TRINITY_DN3367_c0_g1_i9:78-3167(-)
MENISAEINEQNEVIFTSNSKTEADFADDSRRLVVDDSPADADRPQEEFAGHSIQIVETKHDVGSLGGDVGKRKFPGETLVSQPRKVLAGETVLSQPRRILAGETLLSRPRKRQKKIVFDPSNGGYHRMRYPDEEKVDDPLAINDPDIENPGGRSDNLHSSVLLQGRENCGICCLEVEASEAGQVDQLQVAGQSFRSIINTSLGQELSEENSVVCADCENITTSIGHTKSELTRLQKKLNEAVSRLKDLYQRGQTLLETDLEEGGWSDQSICVRVIHELNQPPQREARNLGFTIGASYQGSLLKNRSGDRQDDDGSQLQAVNLTQHQEANCILITQEEWASSGLTMFESRVQIPQELITGLAVGSHRPNFLLSQGACADLGHHTFLCLDCDNRFTRLTDLMSHMESHELNFGQKGDESHANPLEDDLKRTKSDDNIENIEPDLSRSDQQKQERLGIKLSRIKGATSQHQHTQQDVKGSRREFRAFMHKAQFKECEKEVPSLEKPFQCTECNKCFQSAMELWGHQNSFGTQMFDCNFANCKEEFEKLADFAVHYASHGGKVVRVPGDAAGKRTVAIPCPICNTIITGLYKLQRHKMKHDAELKYKCPACPKQFVKANTMRRHIKSIHQQGEKIPILQCFLCHLKLSNQEALTQHLSQIHNIDATNNRQLAQQHADTTNNRQLSQKYADTVNSRQTQITLAQHPALQQAHQRVAKSGTAIELSPRVRPNSAVTQLSPRVRPVTVTQPQSTSKDLPLVSGPGGGGPQRREGSLLSTNSKLRVGLARTSSAQQQQLQQKSSSFRAGAQESDHVVPETSVRKCTRCGEDFTDSSLYIGHALEREKTGFCMGGRYGGQGEWFTGDRGNKDENGRREMCPECGQIVAQGRSLGDHLVEHHDTEVPRFQCSECETRLISLQGCRRHYRQCHRGTPMTCILCKETFSTDSQLHSHLASCHQEIIGAQPEQGSGNSQTCRYCETSFSLYEELVIHVRFNHLLETIDISSTELEEVTMIGGHVVEFSEDGSQIVALHTIP